MLLFRMCVLIASCEPENNGLLKRFNYSSNHSPAEKYVLLMFSTFLVWLDSASLDACIQPYGTQAHQKMPNYIHLESCAKKKTRL